MERKHLLALGESRACWWSRLYILGRMLPQTWQSVEKGILPRYRPWPRWLLGIGRRERLYCTHPAKVSLLPAEKRNRGLERGRGWGEVEVVLGLKFSKESKITEVMCQQQVHIHQQRQHKFIYILLLPAQDEAIFLVDKCNLKCFTCNLLILETQRRVSAFIEITTWLCCPLKSMSYHTMAVYLRGSSVTFSGNQVICSSSTGVYILMNRLPAVNKFAHLETV